MENYRSVYDMYVENNKKTGFWISRNSWRNVIAKVVKVEGNYVEEKEQSGQSEIKMFVKFYNIDTGKEQESYYKGDMKEMTPLTWPTKPVWPHAYQFYRLEDSDVKQHFGFIPGTKEEK